MNERQDPAARRIDDFDLVCRALKKKPTETIDQAARRVLRKPSEAWPIARAVLDAEKSGEWWPAVHRAAERGRRAGYR